MEDQQPDSDNLTTPDASVPEGKSGRRKHSVPRSKLRQQVDDDGAELEPKADEAEPEAETEPEAEPEPESEPAAAPERRRLPWRRNRAAVSEPAETETAAVELVDSEATENATTALESVTDAVDESPAEVEPEAEPEAILVPHRTAPRGLKIAAAVASVLVVGATAFAGAMLQPSLSERADVQVKQQVAETAAAAITSLWTYTPDDIDELADRTARYLGGDFAAQYRTFIDSIAEANKQAQVTNQTQVVGAAVESLTATDATAIVYTNSVSTTPSSQGFQSIRYLSYRLTLENRDRKWLITKMNDITSLDLTPRL